MAEERTCPELAEALIADANAGRLSQISPKEARAAGFAIKLVSEEGWPNTSTPTYPPELVKRMVALVREVAADREANGAVIVFDGTALVAEARAIVALLPEPVDPDLLEAREIAAGHSKKGSFISISAGECTADHIRAGRRDDDVFVQTILAAIRRGRELAGAAA